jgi:3-hydroxyisobutyrate dehydrogenase
MKLGVAGLGRMGAAMVRRLIEVGHEVHVWNRTSGRAKALIDLGACEHASARALADACEVVITIVTDAKAIDEVYRGANGLLSGSVAGKLFIEMSTVQPAVQIDMARSVTAAGAQYVECPVGGTVGPALQGKLIGLIGGEPDAVTRAKPILDQLCRRADRVGPVGAGSSVKLAINLPLAVYWQALGESYSLCKHLGLDEQWLVELFADSSGGPNVMKARGSAVATAMKTGGSGSATFDCDSIRKDLRTMVAEARDRGFDLPIAARTLQVYDGASHDGWGGRDCTELPTYWSTRPVKSS